jgi:hypothetical protein
LVNAEVYSELTIARSGVDRKRPSRHREGTKNLSAATAHREEFMAKSQPKAVAMPKRPRRWLRTLIGLVVVISPLTVAGVLASQAPQFYVDRLDVGDEQKLEELASQFLSRGSRLYNSIVSGSNAWRESFDESSINAWFAYDLKRNHQRSLPKGVSEPRMALEHDCLRVGFRWGFGPVSSVVQIAVKTWVYKENNLAVELKGASAGSLPLPTTYVRRVVESVAERNGCEIHWKRNGANLVALITLPERGIKLRRAEVADGCLILSGKSVQLASIKMDKTHR